MLKKNLNLPTANTFNLIVLITVFLLILFLYSCAQMGTGLSSSQLQKVRNLDTISDTELRNLYYDVSRKIKINKAQMQDASNMNNPIAQGFEQGQHSNLLEIKEKIIIEMNSRGMEVQDL